MKWTKTREKLGAAIALFFVVFFGTIVAAFFGFNIPVISDILRNVGIL